MLPLEIPVTEGDELRQSWKAAKRVPSLLSASPEHNKL